MKTILLILMAFSVQASLQDWKTFQGHDLVTNSNSKLVDNTKNIGVFYFLSADCPCSKGYFQYLNSLKSKYPEFNFMGFHSSRSIKRSKSLKYFGKFDINFPILDDKSLKYANKFEATKTPHVFVLNAKGETLYHGGVTNSRMMSSAKKFYLEEVLTDLKNNKKPRHSYARALGCRIAR